MEKYQANCTGVEGAVLIQWFKCNSEVTSTTPDLDSNSRIYQLFTITDCGLMEMLTIETNNTWRTESVEFCFKFAYYNGYSWL